MQAVQKHTLHSTAGWVRKDWSSGMHVLIAARPASAADFRLHLCPLSFCRSIQCHAGAPLRRHL